MRRIDLSREAYEFLQKLFRGIAVGKALEEMEQANATPPQAMAQDIQTWFASWLAQGVFRQELEPSVT